MTEIIEQNFSIVKIFYFVGPYVCFMARLIFSADDVTHMQSSYKMQNQRKSYFSFIV